MFTDLFIATQGLVYFFVNIGGSPFVFTREDDESEVAEGPTLCALCGGYNVRQGFAVAFKKTCLKWNIVGITQ